MEIRILKKEEFNTLLKVMNDGFNFVKESEKFETILPKYYSKYNKDQIHFGLFLSNQLVASIGVYPFTLKRKDKILNAAMVGGVTTLKEHRGKGYFYKLMSEVMSYCDSFFDLLVLSGKRERYNLFGFENAGLVYAFKIHKKVEKDCKKVIKSEILNKNDLDNISKCLSLYNQSSQIAKRYISNFYDVISSWNGLPYLLKKEDEVVGYYCIKDDKCITELIYQKEHIKDIIDALKEDYDEFEILGSYDDIKNGLDKYVDETIKINYAMYKIINYPKVIEYLDFNDFDKNHFESLNELEKVRYVLGVIEDTKRDLDSIIHVHNADMG